MISLDREFPRQHQQSNDTWDRFIRNRKKTEYRFVNHRKYDLEEEDDTDKIINKRLYSSSQEMYKKLLASTLSLPPPPQSWTYQWPVKARNNPNIRTPSVIMDLPNIRNTSFGDSLMDWSSTNYLTVAFPRSAYLWHAPTDRTLRIPGSNLTCIKWNPEGNALFVASKNGTFKYLDVDSQEEVTTSVRSPCHLGCFITTCGFHPTVPLMFIGCSKGSLNSYYISKGMNMIRQICNDIHDKTAITCIRFSSDGSYMAVASMSSTILVYDTQSSSNSAVYGIEMNGPSRTVAWHPWKRNYLVVADSQGYMALYNINSTETPEATYTSVLDSAITGLTFNPHTAELVVSQRIFYNAADTHSLSPVHSTSQINVLASFDRVVDRLEGHSGKVPFLNWSPDGTQLATAGTDETARIWDFLPSNKKQRTRKLSCKLNYVSAALEIANNMGLVIR